MINYGIYVVNVKSTLVNQTSFKVYKWNQIKANDFLLRKNALL